MKRKYKKGGMPKGGPKRFPVDPLEFVEGELTKTVDPFSYGESSWVLPKRTNKRRTTLKKDPKKKEAAKTAEVQYQPRAPTRGRVMTKKLQKSRRRITRPNTAKGFRKKTRSKSPIRPKTAQDKQLYPRPQLKGKQGKSKTLARKAADEAWKAWDILHERKGKQSSYKPKPPSRSRSRTKSRPNSRTRKNVKAKKRGMSPLAVIKESEASSGFKVGDRVSYRSKTIEKLRNKGSNLDYPVAIIEEIDGENIHLNIKKGVDPKRLSHISHSTWKIPRAMR